MPLFTTTCDRASLARPLATGDGVGPGTYSVDAQGWHAEDVKCGFSSSKRQPMHRWKSKSVAPSPATYDVRSDMTKPPPDRQRTESQVHKSALRSKGPRLGAWRTPGSTGFLPSTIKDNPGPGEYDPQVDRISACDIDKMSPKLDRSGHAVPILGVSMSAPAIPVLRDPSKAKYTGRTGNSLGPGDYEADSMQKPCHVMRKTAPVIDFHASGSEWRLFPPPCSIDFLLPAPSNPGAGTYNIKQDIVKGKGTEQPFKSKVPQQIEIKNDNPGPGTYPKEDDAAPAEKEREFPGLRSSTSRSQPEWWRPNDKQPLTSPDYLTVPGPGHYTSASGFFPGEQRRARSSGDILGRTYHAVHTPALKVALRDSDGASVCVFGSSEEKTNLRQIVKQGVSPGDYDNTEAMGQSMMSNIRSREPIGRKGVFGTCGAKDHGSAFAAKNTDQPGPGAYEQGVITADKRYLAPTQPGMASFKNEMVQRPGIKPMSAGQSPGQYETLGAFEAVNYRNPYRKPATQHISFGLSQDRMDKREVFPGTLNLAMPGPGVYDQKVAASSKGGGSKSTDGRMKTPRGGNPLSPGMYEVRSSLLKKTFNVAGHTHARRAQGQAPLADTHCVGGGAGGGAAASRARVLRVQPDLGTTEQRKLGRTQHRASELPQQTVAAAKEAAFILPTDAPSSGAKVEASYEVAPAEEERPPTPQMLAQDVAPQPDPAEPPHLAAVDENHANSSAVEVVADANQALQAEDVASPSEP